jgi:sugar O-acyltransferase (sialic acid O-acetyltransferase NeuD family)
MTLGIIGAGELGQQIAHYARIAKICSKIIFFDDLAEEGYKTPQGKVIGKTKDIEQTFKSGLFDYIFIGIGYKYMEIRKHFFKSLYRKIPFVTIIHPNVYVDPSSKIGEGTILYPGCIIDKKCTIGNNVLLNIGSIICHDSTIGDHSFIGPGANLAGFVNVGQSCFIGIGTICIDNISICNNTQTAGGAVIINNIVESGFYAGVPAILKKKF